MRSELTQLYPRIWRFAFSLTGNKEAAEELAQATALRAIEQASKFTIGTSLPAWLFTMTRRVWLNELRASRIRGAGRMVPVDEVDLPSSESCAETTFFQRQVVNEIMRLPEAQRSTVVLVYVEGHTYREASQILDVPIGTVMSRLSAARKTLQSLSPVDKVSNE